MAGAPGTESTGATPALRRLLLALVVFGMLATALDLYLLEHSEDAKMLVPFGVIGSALLVIAWHVTAPSAASVRVLRVVMAASVVAGLVGVVLHYQGNMEFQLDINPDMSNWELFSRVMHAKAPPALAPGAMAQLGLMGLIYTYRHPALGPKATS